MTDSYVKDIVYDLIASKLRIKELEDKLTSIELENKELTTVNAELKSEVDKWKTQVVAYINDYCDVYNKPHNDTDDSKKVSVNNVVNTEVEVIVDNKKEDDSKKTRGEYMKEYMRTKRKKQKEELKNVVVNKN